MACANRQYVDHVEQAADPGRPKAEQATVLWAAAQLAREQGMALLGTELEPDWAIQWPFWKTSWRLIVVVQA